MPYYSILIRHQDGSTTRAFEAVENDVRTGFVDTSGKNIDVVNGEDTIQYVSREPLDNIETHGFETPRPIQPLIMSPAPDLKDSEEALD